MSDDWSDYFECKERLYCDGGELYYEYKDKSVVKLPANLLMPPTDTFYNMFDGCSQLQDITALANWNVSNVRWMEYMFQNCSQLQDITALANWNVSNVKDMRGMFSKCGQLQNITALANWDISNIKYMLGMFHECHQLEDMSALSGWDVSKIERTRYSPCRGRGGFRGCREGRPMFRKSRTDDSTEFSSQALHKQDRTLLLNSLWERVKPLLKNTTPLNGYFKHYIRSEDLPSDWQTIGTIRWNP